MSMYATVAEFETMDKLAASGGLTLECRSVSNGGCRWSVLYTIKKGELVVLETTEKWRVQDFLIAFEFLTSLITDQ